jgi:hypothetical protein
MRAAALLRGAHTKASIFEAFREEAQTGRKLLSTVGAGGYARFPRQENSYSGGVGAVP